ncbi:neprilysin-1 [Patella vulgata]|uniref:neprilysin-1 n=1 Tax=Patella vulgata TaxID=6465 RepID=UPI00217FFA9F|nr:neprilysin-1 [Patella vulgata]
MADNVFIEEQCEKCINDVNDRHLHIKRNNNRIRRCWKRRTKLEIWLIVFGGIVSLTVLAVIIALIILSSRKDTICMSAECIRASSRIMDHINSSVDPCDDFYQFACGAWLKSTVIPADRSSVNQFTILRDEVEVILKNALEKESSEDISAIKKTKDLYKSCLNLTAMEELGIQPLVESLLSLGGWPVLQPSWNESTFDLVQILAKLKSYKISPIINLFVGIDFKNSSSRSIYIDQPTFGMPGRRYYLRDRDDIMVQAYEKYAIEMSINLGADQKTVKNDFTEMVDFEFQLANISVAAEDRRDNEILYNPSSIADLTANYSKFEWFEYIKQVFEMDGVELNITLDEIIINRAPRYFDQLFILLERTPARILANYVLFRLVLERAPLLTNIFRDILVDYHKVISGINVARDRFRTCVGYVKDTVYLGVNRLYIDDVFGKDSKTRAQDMIGNLRSAFNELLDELNWMDEPTRKLAREKVEHIDSQIGYYDSILDDSYLNLSYENRTYHPLKYYENVEANQNRVVVGNLKNLRTPISRNAPSYLNAATVNAFYSPQRNAIIFPAGILQPPFYHKHFPRVLNYGGIGVVIGHEITHGFDDSGRQYDKDGNLLQWWTDDVIGRFKEKTKCIVDQYSNYIIKETGMNINGNNTQGENIADNGGLKQSYRAYRRAVEKYGDEAQLPGLKYNNDQLFFINFAQIWCTNMRKQGFINQILTGVHSPGRYRVIGSLQNSKDFAKAFSCPVDSYMNPNRKCCVW